MRRIRSILGLVAVATLVAPSLASAGKLDDCHKPPPAWFTARSSHTYSQSWGAGYGARASTHEYSAQRRSYTPQPRFYAPQRHDTTRSYRLRDPFGRW